MRKCDKIIGSTPRSHDVLKLIQCPVCLEMPNPPIYSCRSGHIVCNSCQERTLVCPICGELYSKARNMVAEKVLEKYTMACKYQNDGCEGNALSGCAYFDHIHNCDFRPVPCPSCNDGTTIRYPEYLGHLETAHGVNGQNSPGGTLEYNLDFTILTADRADRQKFVWPPFYYKAYNETFLLRVVGDSKRFASVISLIGPKYKTLNYIVSIKLHYPPSSPQGKFMEWRGFVTHFRDDPFDVGCKNGQGLVVPFNVIKNISTTAPNDNISEWIYTIDIRKISHRGLGSITRNLLEIAKETRSEGINTNETLENCSQ